MNAPFLTDLPPVLDKPLFRFDRSFEENAAAGPDFAGPFPAVPDTPMKEFFGLPVASRVGLAASLVLNERWFDCFSRLGFDILTYKTIRSRKKIAHPAPNWVYPDPASVSADPGAVLRLGDGALPADPLRATAVGSVGMPSSDPAFWREDIRACRAALRPGQVFIVSVVGTALPGLSPEAFVEDFCQLAREAKAAGAQVIETNFSCPNVTKSEGELYLDTPLATRIATAVRAAIGDTPLLVKIGAVSDAARMTELLHALGPVVDGITMINAPSRELLDADGAPAFGENRRTAGMMGGVNYQIARACVEMATTIVARDGIDCRILAVGGVTTPERIAGLFEAGAYAVLAASGAVWDPYLAIRSKQLHPDF
ncbi:beta/alpha barrel domain-containing protein [Pseudodonghicola flavimaris]|uniref:Dihydroorotate dehydrogenase catalytic domain-containing protein n=1 Tax=Pseudodonghicola flavimaris TaxID=3050036 RepID=A0ABT7F2B7_9RHOB|nr:hypothetical protein [Pseudodonghicola flavimaris]MDK3018752.1 hypothetical protein [Pseudodonghicola flavimaris]